MKNTRTQRPELLIRRSGTPRRGETLSNPKLPGARGALSPHEVLQLEQHARLWSQFVQSATALAIAGALGSDVGHLLHVELEIWVGSLPPASRRIVLASLAQQGVRP